ncbi:LLM class flavin-dependent oxidoreductase [Gordonia sp. DT30]|uniref:LLM class flavin-dependent oxidoreductase n=1 Tax=unclassified Gordonia (in: high G+C Gram-positive bacteria) TaxID=2657482 RepID=UPI003CED1757
MRLGFAPSGRRNAQTTVELAKQAEDAGFAEIWVSEDYLERGAFAVAGAVAASTERVTIGLGVINPWTRHVALSAMECAALEELSGGRLRLGVGASNRIWIEEQLGIPFRRPVSVLVEYVDALRTLLDGDRHSRPVNGLEVDAALAFTPGTRIPILLGVKGERALSRSASSDGLILSVLSSPEYVSWVRENFSPRSVTAYVLFSRDSDPGAARARVAGRIAQYLGMHGPSPITALPGLSAETATAFRENMLAGTDASDLVTDEMSRTFAIAGNDEQCADILRRFSDAGVDSLVIVDAGTQEPTTIVSDVAAIADKAGIPLG